MRLLVSFVLGAAVVSVLSLGALVCGCSADPPTSGTCTPQPAFQLTVRGGAGASIPDTTRITVKGGSGVETFFPGESDGCPTMVFCTVARENDAGPSDDGGAPCVDGGDVDAGPGVQDVTVIRCALWTDGAAEVDVTARGFVTQHQMLQAKTDGCGVVTVPADVEMLPVELDGGTLASARSRVAGGASRSTP